MKTMHMHLSVRGALKNMTRGELAKMFRNPATGKLLNADEAKDALLDRLAAGHEVIPCGPPCEGFDYAGGGCPGHEVTENA